MTEADVARVERMLAEFETDRATTKVSVEYEADAAALRALLAERQRLQASDKTLTRFRSWLDCAGTYERSMTFKTSGYSMTSRVIGELDRIEGEERAMLPAPPTERTT